MAGCGADAEYTSAKTPLGESWDDISPAWRSWQCDWLVLIWNNCLESQFYCMPSHFFPSLVLASTILHCLCFLLCGMWYGQKCACFDSVPCPRYFCRRKGSGGTWLHWKNQILDPPAEVGADGWTPLTDFFPLWGYLKDPIPIPKCYYFFPFSHHLRWCEHWRINAADPPPRVRGVVWWDLCAAISPSH